MIWGITVIILIIVMLKEAHDMKSEPENSVEGTITLEDGKKLRITITEDDDDDLYMDAGVVIGSALLSDSADCE